MRYHPCKCYEDGHNDIDDEDYNGYNNDDDNDNCDWMAREMVIGMIVILKIMIPCLWRRLKKNMRWLLWRWGWLDDDKTIMNDDYMASITLIMMLT